MSSFIPKSFLAILASLLFISSAVRAQSALKVTRDTIKVWNAELEIRNASRDSVGVLYNLGNGKTVFKRIRLQNLGDTAIAIPGQDTLAVKFTGGGAAATIPEVSLAAKLLDAANMLLKWWQTDAELYQSPKIGVIGDSQGRGSYASTYANSIVGRLQAYITAVASNAVVSNYCMDGYNSRRLAPTGSNSFVDTLRNVTKAIADGNSIIILMNTSNDYASNSAGGETSTEEALSNTLLIEEACKKAGVQLLVVSSFPRTQLGAAQRAKLNLSGDNLRKTFGPRCAYVYHLLEDPANPDLLLPSLEVGDNIHLNDQGCLIVFNAVRNMLSSYFTSNTDVAKYIVQRGTAYTGPFADYRSITSPGGTTLNVPKDGTFYRVRIYFRDGYFSRWSNPVKADPDGSVPVTPLPLVNVGNPVTITLPASSVTLTATASAQNGGSITGYQWSKVQGGAATFGNATAATTTVTGLVQGSYIFRCTVTDNNGTTNSAEVSVTVIPAADPSGIAKFNFNQIAQNISGWVDVSGGPLNPTSNGATWTDNVTGINLVCPSNGTAVWGNMYSGFNVGNDNGEQTADAGGFATDPLVISSAWYSNNVNYASAASNQLKLTGLNPAKKYRLTIYSSLASRFSLNATPTVLIINNSTINKREVPATGNTSAVAVFQGVKPDASGEIPLFVGAPAGTAVYGMINGLTIKEETVTGAPVVNAGQNVTLVLPANSATLKAALTDASAEITNIAWTKTSGGTATIATPSSMSTSITDLQAGTYVFRCTLTDKGGLTGYGEVTVTVNTVNTNPTMKVAFSKFAFTSSGWSVLTGEPHVANVTGSQSFGGNTVGISVGNWTPFYTYSADATGQETDDGGGFSAPARVVKGNFFNINTYNASNPQVQVTNLPAGTYNVTVFGSISTATANDLTADCTTQYRVNGSAMIPVNNKGNTSKTATFNNIIVAANGAINIFVNPTMGNNTSYIASLSYFIIEKVN